MKNFIFKFVTSKRFFSSSSVVKIFSGTKNFCNFSDKSKKNDNHFERAQQTIKSFDRVYGKYLREDISDDGKERILFTKIV